jgi:Na+:H+ antiporter, NhaC family
VAAVAVVALLLFARGVAHHRGWQIDDGERLPRPLWTVVVSDASGTPQDAAPEGMRRPARQPRPPTMLDALLPVLVLIALLALTIALFGVDATNGPLQVALLLAAAFASLVAFKNGHTAAAVADAAVGGVTSAIGAVFILLAVGALIGTWNMAGTIPTVVDYGIRLVNPAWFFFTATLVCAVVGMVTGSSWTTAGTLGVAFVAMATVMELPVAVAAGAVICGAYFGDKMTPLSETTILVPKLVGRGLTVGTHVRNMLWTAGPALGVSLILFLVIGFRNQPASEVSTAAAEQALESAFNVSVLCLLPLLLLIVFALLKYPPFLSILGSALFAGLLAPFIQPDAVRAFVAEPDQGHVATGVEALFGAMATGFVSDSGAPKVDELFSRGGMASLLTTVWLILGALSFAAVMEHAGFLQRLLTPIVARTRRRGSLIMAVSASGVGLNVIAGDQYVADVLPSRMFRDEFARRGLAPQVLSRAVEDSGTVTSVLVPWNTCGAYISGVLGVPTSAYLPYCFFNILSPILDVAYGYLGFKVATVPPEPAATGPTGPDDRRSGGAHETGGSHDGPER